MSWWPMMHKASPRPIAARHWKSGRNSPTEAGSASLTCGVLIWLRRRPDAPPSFANNLNNQVSQIRATAVFGTAGIDVMTTDYGAKAEPAGCDLIPNTGQNNRASLGPKIFINHMLILS